jgi:hypothetical protein
MGRHVHRRITRATLRDAVTATVRLGATTMVTLAMFGLAACSTGGASAGVTSVDGKILSTAQPLASDCAGVTVVVEFDILDAQRIDECVEVSTETPAADILNQARVTLAGTDAYGDAVVCRVNDLPSVSTSVTVDGHDPFIESCASMPPEFAYWALWVKQGSTDWGYAMEGVSDLMLKPGDSIGLVFTTGTSTPTPS